ncbi:hypothetical protein Pmani_019046 [Petrolisthes manimaculis]|uniref:Uncharacterized protein n=1 Tax=Petrolisthes manimaculis TaxID=1843537 RepID=A0AAE1U636_9EUCA|nr:hypothetical protein Pmani_019046 [Petrolisthes manimaculis]
MEKKGKEQLESQLAKIKRELRRKELKLQKYTQVLGAKQHVRETIERQRLVSEEQSASGSRHNESQDSSNVQFMSSLSRMVTFSADEPEVIFVTPSPDVKSKNCDENNSANENEIVNAKSLVPNNAEAIPVIEMPLAEDMTASDINEPVEQFPRKDVKSLTPTTQINVKKSTHRSGHPSLSRRNSEVCVEPVCFPHFSSSSQSTETNVLLSSSPVNPKQMDQYVDILSMDNYSSSGNQPQSNKASLNNFDGTIQENRKQGVENQSMETNVLHSSSVNPKQMDQIVLSMDSYSSGNQAQSNRAPLNKIDCKIKEDSTHKQKALFGNAEQSQDLFGTQSKKGKEKLEVSRKVLSQRERRQHHRTASQSSSSEGSTTGTVKQCKRRFIVNVDTEHKVDSHTSHKQPKRVEDMYSDDALSTPETLVQGRMLGQRFIINADTEQQREDFHTPGTKTRKQPRCEDMCGDDVLSEELMIKEMEREIMKDATSSNDIFFIAKKIDTNLGEKLMIKNREREVMKEAKSNDVFFISREIDTALESGMNHTVNEEAKVIKEMEIKVMKDATSNNDVFLITREIDTTLKPATTSTSGETTEESVVNRTTNTTFNIVKSHEQYNKDVSRHADICNGEVTGIKDFGKVLTTNFINTRCSSPWLLIVQELGLSVWKKKVNSEVWEADSTAPYPVARSSGVRNVVAVVLKSSEEVRFLVVSPSVSKDVLHIVYAQFNHQEREWIITKTDCSSTLWYLGDTSTCCALDDWTITFFCKQHQMPSTLPMLIIVDFDVTFSSRRKEWELVCHPHTKPLSQDEYFTSLVPLSMSDAVGVVLCSTHTHMYIFDVFNSTRIARLKLPELTPFWAIAHKELIFMLSKNKEKKEICLCAMNPVTGNAEDIFSWSHNSERSLSTHGENSPVTVCGSSEPTEYYTQPSNSWKNRRVHLSGIAIVWWHYPLLDIFPTQSGNHQYRGSSRLSAVFQVGKQ